MKSINWNDHVTLRPNSLGWKIYNAHYERLKCSPPINDGLKLEISLWEAAHIFGAYMYNGCMMPFFGTEIELRRMA